MLGDFGDSSKEAFLVLGFQANKRKQINKTTLKISFLSFRSKFHWVSTLLLVFYANNKT